MQYYSDERNVQILVDLLKQYGIKKIVVSPGSTNVTFVGSLQCDPFFEMYSCVDERSAAYMACGLSVESGEPVVLSCTGATASRNYFSALTEAYYRKIQILAVTSTQDEKKIGHYIPQVIDRSCQPKDTVKYSTHLQIIRDASDERDVTIKANYAIQELNHHGKGPVHINLTTGYSNNFKIQQLPSASLIRRFTLYDKGNLPEIKAEKIAIYVGSHTRWNANETKSLERFCECYNAVVFVEATSNYHGKYKVSYSLKSKQETRKISSSPDLLIHIGEVSDDYFSVGSPKEVWRVSEDGKFVDTFGKLTNVYEMEASLFFNIYTEVRPKVETSYYERAIDECSKVWESIPELPFSHLWVASKMYNKLPQNSTLHLGILSPLRSWGYFPIDNSIEVYCNQGGFGIDGNLSTMIGASLVNRNRIYFAVVGDLSFFYDLNSLGNRHIQNNIRILLINNSLGAEFHLKKQLNSVYLDPIEKYISAGGHFGHQSKVLVKHYANDLGFEYISANNKEEFLSQMTVFCDPNLTEKPIVFEVFTQVDDENEALSLIWASEQDKSTKKQVKRAIKGIVGDKVVNVIKKVVK